VGVSIDFQQGLFQFVHPVFLAPELNPAPRTRSHSQNQQYPEFDGHEWGSPFLWLNALNVIAKLPLKSR
jgi:hypothetical protein